MNFIVGEIVKLRVGSRYYCSGEPYNPKDTNGVIININNNVTHEHPIIVRWDVLYSDGEIITNCYNEDDLVSTTNRFGKLNNFTAFKYV